MKVLNPKGIADRLHKDQSWVYRNARALGGVKIGGSWVFTQENLERALRWEPDGEPQQPSTKVVSMKEKVKGRKRVDHTDRHGLVGD